MCGLAGVVRFGPWPVDPSVEDRLDAALAHRGPDGHGRYHSVDGRAVLVHRRLAIIDPSPASDQPMADATGRWHLVYNGEIYNYRQLRAELAEEGVLCRTSGDTEVLLQLLVHRGPEGLRAVRGMFALALWDAREQALLVARDRFGIKPLYIARRGEHVAVASELGTLRAAGLVSSEPSAAGVLGFLRWGSVTPPLTFLEDAAALAPGTWRRWSEHGDETGGTFAELHWSGAEDAPAPSITDVEDSLHEAIRASVAAHLVSDVPVGLFLSGGLDSATLLCAASDLGHRLECFTVAATVHADEVDAARAIATAFDAPWRPLPLAEDVIRANIPKAVSHLDQPTIDGPNSWVVAGAAAAAGLKTALSGTGADELFGGYPSSRLIPRWARLGHWAAPAARAVARFDRLRQRPTRALRLEHVATHDTIRERYRAVRGFFLPSELEHLTGPRLAGAAGRSAAAAVDAVESSLLSTNDGSVAAAVAAAESQVYLRSQLLRDLDVTSMAHALEVRVPFVDHELLAATWPRIGRYPQLLSRKRVLRDMLRGRVPHAVLTRRKTGFTMPFEKWLRGDLRQYTRDGMAVTEQHGWIASGQTDRVWREFEDGRQHWSRPWGLCVLGHHLAR